MLFLPPPVRRWLQWQANPLFLHNIRTTPRPMAIRHGPGLAMRGQGVRHFIGARASPDTVGGGQGGSGDTEESDQTRRRQVIHPASLGFAMTDSILRA